MGFVNTLKEFKKLINYLKKCLKTAIVNVTQKINRVKQLENCLKCLISNHT